MSLINDALKKAERQRAGSVPPMPVDPVSGPQGSTARKTPVPTLVLVGGGALLGLALAIGAALLWPRSSVSPGSETVAKRPSAAAPVPVIQPAAPTVAVTAPAATPAVSPPPLTEPIAPAKTVIAAAPATGPQPETVPAKSEPPVVAKVELPAENKTPPPTPAAPSGPSASFTKKVESFRVAGIRFAGAESKVIMNDRVYRIGETVDHEQGIKLTAVTTNSLTFVDAAGATYTRHF